jgi:hypothetical protein
VRLDPYALEETTITLEEWRRLNPPAPRARRTRTTSRPRKHAA